MKASMIWQEMILRRRPEMIPGVIPGKETLPGQILTPGNPPVRIQSLRMMTRSQTMTRLSEKI